MDNESYKLWIRMNERPVALLRNASFCLCTFYAVCAFMLKALPGRCYVLCAFKHGGRITKRYYSTCRQPT